MSDAPGAADALDLIQGLAAKGDVAFVEHALIEARADGLSVLDVVAGLAAASACTLQENGRWRVHCPDTEGAFTAIVRIRGDVLVITVFRRGAR